MLKLRQFDAIELQHCATPQALLEKIGGPSEVFLIGQDTAKTRVVVTLLHANEPSGLNAILAYIKSGKQPATNTIFIIASVTAALTKPIFYYRMLPGQEDLNRCFTTPPKSAQGVLAETIKSRITQLTPEWVVDIHNTSGDGPAFCVITEDSSAHLALASYFAKRIILTDIKLGSLMEQNFGCPVVTFEAGGSDNDVADNLAFERLSYSLDAQSTTTPLQDCERLINPRRLELMPNQEVTFVETPQPSPYLQLRHDIETFNFGVTPANTRLGWSDGLLTELLKMDKFSDHIQRFFEIRNQQLFTCIPLRLFMVTTRPDIAKSDCLFYFAEVEN